MAVPPAKEDARPEQCQGAARKPRQGVRAQGRHAQGDQARAAKSMPQRADIGDVKVYPTRKPEHERSKCAYESPKVRMLQAFDQRDTNVAIQIAEKLLKERMRGRKLASVPGLCVDPSSPRYSSNSVDVSCRRGVAAKMHRLCA